MKLLPVGLVASFSSVASATVDHASHFAVKTGESPVGKVVLFIKELKKEVEGDKAAEESAFKTYKEWCDTTVKQTSNDIVAAQKVIAEKTAEIESFGGLGGASAAQIKHLQKTLLENEAETKDAIKRREEGKEQYDKAIADFDSGISTMKDMESKFGGGGSSFLAMPQDMEKKRQQAAQLLQIPLITAKISKEQREEINNFIHPDTELMQLVGGDAPESATAGVINILRETREDYEKDKKTAEEDEKKKVEAYDTLMTNLAAEKATVEKDLGVKAGTKGNAMKDLMDAKLLRSETENTMKADKKVLVETQDACEKKTFQFNQRSALRVQELQGIDKALEILDSSVAQQTFENSGKVSFIQMVNDGRRKQAYAKVQALAAEHHSLALAQIAMQVQSAHAFDKVFEMIDKQIKALTAEGKQDVEHKDMCQKQRSDNTALIQSLTDTAEKTATKIERLTSEKTRLQKDFDEVVEAIGATETEMKEMQDLRNTERAEHETALNHDKEALGLIGDAIAAITQFYRQSSQRSLSFLQIQDAAKKQNPDTPFDDKDYVGAKDATNGVVRMLKVVEEDMKNEIAAAQKADAANADQFSESYKGLTDKLDTQTKTKITLEKDIASSTEDITSKDEIKTTALDEKTQAEADKVTLEKNCAWVEENFLSRAKARQAEISGLGEAKGLLEAAASER